MPRAMAFPSFLPILLKMELVAVFATFLAALPTVLCFFFFEEAEDVFFCSASFFSAAFFSASASSARAFFSSASYSFS